ncbi:MAG: FecR domain-containing protein [Acidobacteriota bacterium]|nr:FecR domain-containing protein [Acidobacteriota bacterium]
MRPAKKIRWAFFFLMPFLFAGVGNALANVPDDYAPEVTARVARISFISGDVQIRRADSQHWERAANNLPIVEGDEIATDANARLEIQFNSYNYLRLSENAYLKITTLRDEGIAVSLPNGSISLRVLNFDKDRSYFEIDAPKTTVSVERAGMYRVDAGSRNDSEVRVSVTDSGQARVYSENSGFTLKNGRSATVQIDGNYAGEWETSDASRYADEFDSWSLQRDAIIAKRLQNADYDKYYDRDIYGAEDLNEYGEWIFTKKYGYVWRPFRNSVASYSDWSPYRYGQWRWIPPYGWTWVNDEPWGWATYHHGRWVYDDGWYWTPYPRHRGQRSWWRPALVFISYIGSNICWYPLPYDYGYYNYNYSTYVDRRRYNTTIVNNTTVVVNPPPNQPPVLIVTPLIKKIPQLGVISVPASEFGRNTKGFRSASTELAQKVLSVTPSEKVKPPILPTFKDLNGRVSKEILVENPKIARVETQIKTGATERTSGISTGENLRQERIYGNRSPIEKTDRNLQTEIKGGLEGQPPMRDTGAVTRQPRSVIKQDDGNSDTKNESPNNVSPNNFPIRSRAGKNENESEPQSPVKPSRSHDDRELSPPVYAPPQKQEEREERIERQPRKERQEPVREPEPPRYEPPTKRDDPPPPPRSEPPPSKPEPQPEQKPTEQKPPLNPDRGKNNKDG